MRKRTIAFRAAEEISTAVDVLAAGLGKTASQTFEHLVAEALQLQMLSDAEHPLDVSVFDKLTPRGIALVFHRCEAARRGGENWHFEKPPCGGYWEETGASGWRVIEDNARLTKNGIEYFTHPGGRDNG